MPKWVIFFYYLREMPFLKLVTDKSTYSYIFVISFK